MDEQRLVDTLEQLLLDQAIRSEGLLFVTPGIPDDCLTIDGDIDLRELAKGLKRAFDE